MDDTERAWLREKLYEHAAELGEQKASLRAHSADVYALRQEVREGFTSVRSEISSHYTHLRGEMTATRDEIEAMRKEERRRSAALLDDLTETVNSNRKQIEENTDRSNRMWRVMLVVGSLLVVFGQQFIEHLPRMISLLLSP